MNISNVEFKNSMGTIRTSLQAFNNPTGLIKSASTSTCCANESLNQNQKKFRNKSAIKDDIHFEKFAVEPSSLHFERSLNEKFAKKALQNKQLLYNNVRHLGSCELDVKESSNSPSNFFSNFFNKENERRKKEFHTHNGLDKILVNEHNNNTVLNFALANESNMNFQQRMDATNEDEIVSQSDKSSAWFNSNTSVSQESSSDDIVSSQSSDDFLCSKLSCLNIAGAKYSKEEINLPDLNEHLSEHCLKNGSTSTSDWAVIPNEASRKGTYPDENSEKYNDVMLTEPEENTCQIETITDNKLKNGNNFLAETQEISQQPVERKERNANKPFRRCSSLKIHKESTSTPAQKKIVRFADVLGLDLIDVRTFLDELPSVPKSAYDDLKNEDATLSESPPKFGLSPPTETKSLVPTFTPPATSSNFLEKIRDNFVCLETASVFNSPVCHISGTVRVRNLDFYKSVYVRYTLDNWNTFTEVQASYVPDSCDGFSDKFAFVIYVYTVTIGQRIELAVRYHCCGSIYWDNNSGNNYVFQCFPSAPSMPSYFQCLTPNRDHCNSFY